MTGDETRCWRVRANRARPQTHRTNLFYLDEGRGIVKMICRCWVFLCKPDPLFSVWTKLPSAFSYDNKPPPLNRPMWTRSRQISLLKISMGMRSSRKAEGVTDRRRWWSSFVSRYRPGQFSISFHEYFFISWSNVAFSFSIGNGEAEAEEDFWVIEFHHDIVVCFCVRWRHLRCRFFFLFFVLSFVLVDLLHLRRKNKAKATARQRGEGKKRQGEWEIQI